MENMEKDKKILIKKFKDLGIKKIDFFMINYSSGYRIIIDLNIDIKYINIVSDIYKLFNVVNIELDLDFDILKEEFKVDYCSDKMIIYYMGEE